VPASSRVPRGSGVVSKHKVAGPWTAGTAARRAKHGGGGRLCFPELWPPGRQPQPGEFVSMYLQTSKAAPRNPAANGVCRALQRAARSQISTAVSFGARPAGSAAVASAGEEERESAQSAAAEGGHGPPLRSSEVGKRRLSESVETYCRSGIPCYAAEQMLRGQTMPSLRSLQNGFQRQLPAGAGGGNAPAL